MASKPYVTQTCASCQQKPFQTIARYTVCAMGLSISWPAYIVSEQTLPQQVQQKRRELQEGEMHNYYSSETRSLQMDARTAALKEWKMLSDTDRAVYQAEAAGMVQICSPFKNSNMCQSCLMCCNAYVMLMWYSAKQHWLAYK